MSASTVSGLTDLTLIEAAAALRKGDVSSRELTEACIERIDQHEPDLHAFLALTYDLALQQADAANSGLAAVRKDSTARLPLTCGIPLAIKDVLCLQGVPTTCGSKILEGFLPPYTATSVSRLIAAGSVLLGKTNTDEFAMGSSTENSAYGPTHNPWDLGAKSPGGLPVDLPLPSPQDCVSRRWARTPAGLSASRHRFAV